MDLTAKVSRFRIGVSFAINVSLNYLIRTAVDLQMVFDRPPQCVVSCVIQSLLNCWRAILRYALVFIPGEKRLP